MGMHYTIPSTGSLLYNVDIFHSKMFLNTKFFLETLTPRRIKNIIVLKNSFT